MPYNRSVYFHYSRFWYTFEFAGVKAAMALNWAAVAGSPAMFDTG